MDIKSAIAVEPHRNHGLFSNHYLNEILPKEAKEWKIDPSPVFEKIKRIWESNKEVLSEFQEGQLRKHFIDKILEALGWAVDVEVLTIGGKPPDYALFKNMDDLRSAQKLKKRHKYFEKVLCIGEAKSWEMPLDRKRKGERDLFERKSPSSQISEYLWLSEVKWGILTNGRYWRLFERESSKRLDIYYEIDLQELLEPPSSLFFPYSTPQAQFEAFKYFYLFFRKEAFPDFVEKVFKGSLDYAKSVGEELKENVYNALKILAEGFLKTKENNLKEGDLKDIHSNSFIFLYRILFVLYAESRKLLPLNENSDYIRDYSLDSLKKGIAERVDRGELPPPSTFRYWNRLKELFKGIDSGNPGLSIPSYNGKLFSPKEYGFLEDYKVGDYFVAKVIDFLSRSKDRKFIDYRSLDIRHLGST